jgi:hypothetical protein
LGSQLIDERKVITMKELKEDVEVVKMIYDSIMEYLKSILVFLYYILYHYPYYL